MASCFPNWMHHTIRHLYYISNVTTGSTWSIWILFQFILGVTWNPIHCLQISKSIPNKALIDDYFTLPFRALKIRLLKLWLNLQIVIIWRLSLLSSTIYFFFCWKYPLLWVICFSYLFILHFLFLYFTQTLKQGYKLYFVDLSLWTLGLSCVFPHSEHSFILSFLICKIQMKSYFTLVLSQAHYHACPLNSKFYLRPMILNLYP